MNVFGVVAGICTVAAAIILAMSLYDRRLRRISLAAGVIAVVGLIFLIVIATATPTQSWSDVSVLTEPVEISMLGLLAAVLVGSTIASAINAVTWYQTGKRRAQDPPLACAVWYDNANDEGRPNYILCRDENTAILVAADLIDRCDTTRVMGARGRPNGVQFETGQITPLGEWAAFWDYQDRAIRNEVADREERRAMQNEKVWRMAYDPFHKTFRAPIHLSERMPAWLGLRGMDAES